jgi:hypothetical protein
VSDPAAQPLYAKLVSDPLEMELRKRVRRVLKHHQIIDGVVEADLVAIMMPLAMMDNSPVF